VEETSPEPPEAADAAVGEKKGEGDAVDAGNLTGILDRLSEARNSASVPATA